jgi:hypothetical protein
LARPCGAHGPGQNDSRPMILAAAPETLRPGVARHPVGHRVVQAESQSNDKPKDFKMHSNFPSSIYACHPTLVPHTGGDAVPVPRAPAPKFHHACGRYSDAVARNFALPAIGRSGTDLQFHPSDSQYLSYKSKDFTAKCSALEAMDAERDAERRKRWDAENTPAQNEAMIVDDDRSAPPNAVDQSTPPVASDHLCMTELVAIGTADAVPQDQAVNAHPMEIGQDAGTGAGRHEPMNKPVRTVRGLRLAKIHKRVASYKHGLVQKRALCERAVQLRGPANYGSADSGIANGGVQTPHTELAALTISPANEDHVAAADHRAAKEVRCAA